VARRAAEHTATTEDNDLRGATATLLAARGQNDLGHAQQPAAPARPHCPHPRSLIPVALPDAARASLYHFVLSIPPGRYPRVPPPLRASQFARPRSSRAATTSHIEVFSASSRASRHHLALCSSLSRVPRVPPPSRAARPPGPAFPEPRPRVSCESAVHSGWQGGAVSGSRHGRRGWHSTWPAGARRIEEYEGAGRRAGRIERARGGSRSARAQGGAGGEARGRAARGRKGARRTARRSGCAGGVGDQGAWRA
jgi:hypothetical protein